MNRCKADNERMERARADDTVVQELGNGMRRMVQFGVGYDHMAFPRDCGGGGHGRHGMTIRFILVGPHGGVQWVVNLPNWIPGAANVLDGVEAAIPVSVIEIPSPMRRMFGDGIPTDLGYHSPTPRYEDQTQMECHLLPGGYCYYDGSGLNAGPVLEAFLSHGPHAVWATLARYYKDVLV